MTTGPRQVMGILVPDLGAPFYVELVRGASDTVWASGRSAMICETGGDLDREVRTFELLTRMRAEGVLVCESRLPDGALFPWLHRFPDAVVIDRDAPPGCAGRLRVDRDDGLRQAVGHLVDRGCRYIGYLAAGHWGTYDVNKIDASAAEALVGALRAVGLETVSGQSMSCDSTWEGGYMAARALLVRAPEVDALVCGSDLVAVGALHACASLGKRVPSDVAVVGSDDALIARIARPPLTTLHVPKYQAGTMAAQMLLNRVGGEGVSEELVIEQRLVVRASAP